MLYFNHNMNRFLLLLSFIGFNFFIASAQNPTKSSAYLDYMGYRNASLDKPKIIGKMKDLLAKPDQLSKKQITNVQYHLGRLYEEEGSIDSAIVYYYLSLNGEPNYEVIHRALGFIYLAKTVPVVSQMNAAAKSQNMDAHLKAFAQYKALVLKAIPHLEKYQACDADEETLTIIINLYKSIKDTVSITSIDARLKAMGTKCVTLLDDE
jgi:tetratricopeptide (TPR) repeat protein